MSLDRRDRQNLAVAAIVVILILGAVWLMNAMRRNAELEQCLLARRPNCETPGR